MNESAASPPFIGRWLLRLWRLDTRREEVEQDLLELFRIRLIERGRWFASRRYVADVISMWRCQRYGELGAQQHRFGGLTGMTNDIIFALRIFRRHPGLFGMTIAGLAIAIGISTAVFSVVRTLVTAGYGADAPTSLYRVALTNGTIRRVTGDSAMRGNWSFADYARLRDSTTTVNVVASAGGRAELRTARDQGIPFQVTYVAVSGDYSATLGMRASAGRWLTRADDVPGNESVVVSHGFWTNRLGGDRAVLGRTIWFGDRAFTIVGIADRKHTVPLNTGYLPSFWMTLTAHQELWTGQTSARSKEIRDLLSARKNATTTSAVERERLTAIESELDAPPPAWNPAVEVLGRVKEGSTRAQAESEVQAIAVNLATEARLGVRPIVRLESPHATNASTRTIATILMVVIGLVVFVACANVTNVLLASAASRRREIGTRLAIGASRARILRQLLTESMLLGLISSAIGLFVALRILPTLAALVQVPPTFDVSPDLLVYGALGLLTVVVGILAGLAPARYGQRGDLTAALKIDQTTAPLPLPRARLRSLLIAGQAGISIFLLVVAALLTRSLIESSMLDPGYDVDRLMTIGLGQRSRGTVWTAERRDTYWNGLVEEVRGMPGVAGVALAVNPPFSGRFPPQWLEGRQVARNDVSPEYFATVGIPLLRGRMFTRDEVRAGAPAAVISASLARAVWGSADPIGDSLEKVWGKPSAIDAKMPGPLRKPKDAYVVGVVADAITSIDDRTPLALYLPLTETSVSRLVVRVVRDPAPLVTPIRDAILSFDPSQRPITTLAREELRRQMESPRLLAMLAIVVGATALGLAIIGLFGVAAFVVEQRTHELSVRRALGASERQLIVQLLRENLTPVIVGLGVGVLASLAGTRIVQSQLHGISGRDPIAIAVAILVLMTAAAAAVLVPARRARRVNPAELLKLG